MTRSWIKLPVVLALAAAAGEARADNAAAAETLFVEGRKLLQDKQYEAACPKLAESHKLDPATGTLLALAFCYEGQGKIASAWAAYVEAATRSHNEKNPQRESAAKERVTALEPKLPRLVVELAAGTARPTGMTIARDGETVGEGSLGTAIPVDPGEHTVTAEATGKQPITQKIRLGEGETKRVAVGPFVDVATAAPKPDAPPPGFFTQLRVAGVVSGALGVVGLGVGGGLTGAAVAKKAESDKDCNGNLCGPTGFATRQDARSLGDGATVSLALGGTLAALGLTLILLGGPKSNEAARTTLSPFVTQQSAGVMWGGNF